MYIGAYRVQKRVWDSLELQLQMVMSPPTWVLEFYESRINYFNTHYLGLSSNVIEDLVIHWRFEF